MKEWLPSDLTIGQWNLFKDLVLACCQQGANPSLLSSIPVELHNHRLSQMLADFLIRGDRTQLEAAGRALTNDWTNGIMACEVMSRV